jgi:hypothetical protein
MKMRIIQSRAASLDQVLTPKSGREKEQIRQQELEGAAASGYARLPAAVLTGGRGAESATFGRDRARTTIEGSHEDLVEDRRAGENTRCNQATIPRLATAPSYNGNKAVGRQRFLRQ